MKKLKYIVTLICLLCISCETVFAANRYINLTLTYDYAKHKYNAEEVFVAINGNKLTNLQMPPIILNNYTLVPARDVFEAVGANVEWKKDVEQVFVTYGSKLVVIPINSNKSYVNGMASTMQTSAKIINNKTMIPLRFVSTAVGFDIEWDNQTRVANIITNEDTDSSDDQNIVTEDVTETTTEATTITTTETTTETTTTATTTETTTEAITEAVNIKSISISTSNAKDSITIEGDGPVEATGNMTSDNKAYNLIISNATLTTSSGSLGNATYIKNGFYYQKGNDVNINLTIREKIDFETKHYGNKTVFIFDFAPNESFGSSSNNSSVSEGYSNKTGLFTIKCNKNVDVNAIQHSDDYYNLVYKMTIPGDYSKSINSQTYNINNDYMDTITVNAGSSETVITVKEKRILAFDVEYKDGCLIINPLLPKEKYDKIIVLDAGHGGNDPGASGQGLIEKNLTLSMLLKSKELFDADGSIKCYVTRATDTYPSFDDRVNLGNEVGDAFISIHINSSSNSAALGTETYCYHDNDTGSGLTSSTLAQELLNNLLNNLGTVNRKVKSEEFIVLRRSNIPASLIEIGFISNAHDAALMASESGQQAVAKAVFDSVKNLFNTYKPVR